MGLACGGEGNEPTPVRAAQLALIVAPPAAAPAGSVLTTQPVIQLQDIDGNAVPGAGITVTVSVDGGATIIGAASAPTTTSGRVTFAGLGITGLAGERTLTFSAAGLTAASHRLAVAVGPAARIGVHSASFQGGSVGTAVSSTPAVRITDVGGNPVAGVPVTFAVASGGGALVGATPVSGATGVAAAGSWILGPTAGANAVTATAEGLAGSPITFTASSTVLVPARIEPHAGDGQFAVFGTAVPIAPAVMVQTASGAPVSGVPVTFTVTSGGGSVTGGDQLTDAGGIATAGSWILSGIAGQGDHKLTATASPPIGSVVFSAAARPYGYIEAGAGSGSVLGIVGSALGTAPAVVVTDWGGSPLAGVAVTFSVVSGAGTVVGAQQVTDPAGLATVGAWNLGPTAGVQELRATAPSGFAAVPLGDLPGSVVFSTHALSAPAAMMRIHAGEGQSAPAGAAVPIPPAVIVTAANGMPVAGYPVRFIPRGGTIVGESAITDAAGIAAVASWTLSNEVGTQTLAAVGIDTEVAFTATALPGAPAALRPVPATSLAGTVGQPLRELPAVIVSDVAGNPLSGIPVAFAVGAGGGNVTGAAQVTDADGKASPSSWTMGTVAGINSLIATSAGVPSATLTAAAAAGPPASMELVTGNNQTAITRRRVAVDPEVRLRDQYGNPVPSATVQFVPSFGGGSATPALAVTNALGSARTGWTMGSEPGANTLAATAIVGHGIAPSVMFSAQATPFISPFNIDVRYLSPATAAQSEAVNAAVQRWRDIIIGDVPDVQVSASAGACFETQPALSERIDDILIYIEFVSIDGPGGMLGEAGPCTIRLATGLPSMGVIRLDVADLARFSAGELNDLIRHEIGHALGFGTTWAGKGLLQSGGTPVPYFSGAWAIGAFRALGGTLNHGPGVPVENTGGGGTADSHWREVVLHNELMTGYMGGTPNPLTTITIGSMRDLGYTVDYATAESLAFVLGSRVGRPTDRKQLREAPLASPILVLDDEGRTVGTRGRK